MTSSLDSFCALTRRVRIDAGVQTIHIVLTELAADLPEPVSDLARTATGCGIATSLPLATLKSQAECLEALHYLQPPGAALARQGDGPTAVLLPLETPDRGTILAPIRVWPALDLRHRQSLLLPEQVLFAAVPDGETRIRAESNSSGMAFGDLGTDRAARSGLLELIERDAIFGAWLSGRRLPILNTSQALTPLIAGVQALGVDVLMLDATSDLGVPVAICICSHAGRQITFGTAAAGDMGQAMEKALLEALQMRPFMEEYPAAKLDQVLSDRDVASFTATDTALYWWSSGTLAAVTDHLMDPNPHQPTAHASDSFPDLTERLLQHNMTVVLADLSSDWLHAAGWQVVRVLVPDLLPAFTRERDRPAFHPRWGDLRGAPKLPVPFA